MLIRTVVRDLAGAGQRETRARVFFSVGLHAAKHVRSASRPKLRLYLYRSASVRKKSASRQHRAITASRILRRDNKQDEKQHVRSTKISRRHQYTCAQALLYSSLSIFTHDIMRLIRSSAPTFRRVFILFRSRGSRAVSRARQWDRNFQWKVGATIQRQRHRPPGASRRLIFIWPAIHLAPWWPCVYV